MRFDRLQEVGGPISAHHAQILGRRIGLHRGVEVKRINPRLFRRLDHRRRILRVREDHIHALRDQRLGGLLFRRRIEPRVHPNNRHFNRRINRLRAQSESVDRGDQFRNSKGPDTAQFLGFAQRSRSHTHQVGALIIARTEGREVVGCLIARSVQDRHIRPRLGQFQAAFHIAKRPKDQERGPFGCGLVHDAVGIGAFSDVFQQGHFDRVAIFGFKRLGAQFQRVRPTHISGGRGHDQRHVQHISGKGRNRQRKGGAGGEGGF